MPIISCDRCGKRYKVNEALAGQLVKCPGCGAEIVVPPLTELPDQISRDGVGPQAVHDAHGFKLIGWVVGVGAVVVAGIVTVVILSSSSRRATPVAGSKAHDGASSDQTVVAKRPPLESAPQPTEPKSAVLPKAPKDKQSKNESEPPTHKKEATPVPKAPAPSEPPTPQPSAPKAPPPKEPVEPRDLDAELKQVVVKPPSAFEKVLSLKAHSSAVVAIALTPDASRAVTCSDEGDCRCWDLKTGKELSRYEKKLPGKKFCVAITPDGKYALVGGEFKAIDVWDVQSGKHVFAHTAPKAAVIHVTVTKRGTWMGAADENGEVYTYPLLGGLGHAMRLEGTKLINPRVAFHPKGRYAVVLADGKDAVALVFPTKDVSPHTITIKTVSLRFIESYALTLSDRYFVFHSEREGMVNITPPTPSDGENVDYTFPPSTRFGSHTRLESSALLRVVDDNQFLFAMDQQGQVEVSPARFSTSPITYQTTADDIRALTAATDVLAVAYGHANGEVSLWRLPARPWPRSTRFVQLLDRRFLQGHYDELEAIAVRLLGDGKSVQRFPWDSRRSKHQTMIEYLALGTGLSADEHAKHTKAWLSAHPESVTARLIQAKRFIRAGWEARGSGFANTVSEEGWRVFREKIEEARKIIMPLADGEDPPAEVFPMLFEVAKTQSWDRERVNRYIDKLMKTAPTLSAAHVTVGEMFMRRWGGETGDSQRYALRVAEKIGGAAGDAEYAKVALRLRRYFPPKAFIEATQFDLKRIDHGIAHLAKTAPEDISVFQEGLLLAWLHEYQDMAGLCLTKLSPLDRQWSSTVWGSREGYERARKWVTMWLPEYEDDLVGTVADSDTQQTPGIDAKTAAKNRTAAQHVLKAGGEVHVTWNQRATSRERSASRAVLLPDEPFVVLGVELSFKADAPDLSYLSGLDELQHLTISCAKPADAAVASLGNLPKLTRLRLSGLGITDDALEHVGRFTALKELNLNMTPITDRGLEKLKPLPNLSSLRLYSTDIANEGARQLQAKFPALTSLGVGKTKINDAGVKAIAELKQLKTLRLAETKITGEALAHVAKLPELFSLDLSKTPIEDADLARLAPPKLTILILNDVGISLAGLEHLGQLKTLTHLGLRNSKVTVESAKKFQAVLPKCRISGVKGYRSP